MLHFSIVAFASAGSSCVRFMHPLFLLYVQTFVFLLLASHLSYVLRWCSTFQSLHISRICATHIAPHTAKCTTAYFMREHKFVMFNKKWNQRMHPLLLQRNDARQFRGAFAGIPSAKSNCTLSDAVENKLCSNKRWLHIDSTLYLIHLTFSIITTRLVKALRPGELNESKINADLTFHQQILEIRFICTNVNRH